MDRDQLPKLDEGPGGGRMLVLSGILVHAFVVYGLAMLDGTVELIAIAIDVGPPDDRRSPCTGTQAT